MLLWGCAYAQQTQNSYQGKQKPRSHCVQTDTDCPGQMYQPQTKGHKVTPQAMTSRALNRKTQGTLKGAKRNVRITRS